MHPRTELIVAVAGITVTTFGVIASVMQYKVGDLQAQVALSQLKPQFQIAHDFKKVNSDKYTDVQLQVTNEGGAAYNLKIELLTSLKIDVINGVKVGSIECILYGYNSSQFLSDNLKGLVQTVGDRSNNEKWSRIYDLALKEYGTKRFVHSPKTIFRLSYLDALDNESVEYYSATTSDAVRLTKKAGTQEWQRLENLSHQNERVADLVHLGTDAAARSLFAGNCRQPQ
jgi:hypothetical protein